MKKGTLCIYCGKDESFGPMNMEHYVPKCIWAEKRPVRTMTAPSHIACNSSFSEDNDYFRTVIAFDDKVRPHREAQRVTAGPVTRMMTKHPKQFLNYAKDYALRPRKTEMGIDLGLQPSFSIDFLRIERVLQNIHRGLIIPFARSLSLSTRISWSGKWMTYWMTTLDTSLTECSHGKILETMFLLIA